MQAKIMNFDLIAGPWVKSDFLPLHTAQSISYPRLIRQTVSFLFQFSASNVSSKIRTVKENSLKNEKKNCKAVVRHFWHVSAQTHMITQLEIGLASILYSQLKISNRFIEFHSASDEIQ